MKPKLILHIGSPKSGTSTLQRHYFRILHQRKLLNYLGKSAISNKNFDFKILECDVHFQSFLNALDKNTLNLLSDETFSTSWPSLSFPEKRNYYCPQEGLPIFLKKIINAGVDVHVVIVERNLEQLVLREYVEGYGLRYQWHSKTRNYENYLKTLKNKDTYFSKMFDYDSIASSIISVIGIRNYHVINYTKDTLERDFHFVLCFIGMRNSDLSKFYINSHKENVTNGSERYFFANRRIFLSLAIWLHTYLASSKGMTNKNSNTFVSQSVKPSRIVSLINLIDSLVPSKRIFKR
jgi:hypothetical protein